MKRVAILWTICVILREVSRVGPFRPSRNFEDSEEEAVQIHKKQGRRVSRQEGEGSSNAAGTQKPTMTRNHRTPLFTSRGLNVSRNRTRKRLVIDCLNGMSWSYRDLGQISKAQQTPSGPSRQAEASNTATERRKPCSHGKICRSGRV